MKKKVFALFLCSWSFLILISSGTVESQDGLQYVTIARQMYYHNTFAMPSAKYPHDNIHMNVEPGRDGKEFSPTGLGYSLAYLPAVALEDFFNRSAGAQPTQQFPLDHDWPIMLFGSMTNAFFGALLVTTFFLFLKTFNFTDTRAALLAVSLFASSNLLVYSKHAFAHQMFISFMLLSFYFIRLYRLKSAVKYIVYAALSCGVVLISYNPTYLFITPALGVYYLFSLQYKSIISTAQTIIRDVVIGLVSISPFIALYSWFNWVRFGGAISTGYGTGAISAPPVPPAFVFFEGVWGILFSPGKSIFLFSPLLLLLLLFWFKFKKEYLPEITTFFVLFGVYLVFIASLFAGEDFFPWHGEASFGPRYMLPILPFAILLVALLHRELNVFYRRLIFWPIVVIGICIQLVGVLIPYQVRFTGLEYQYWINGHRITYDTYANFLPRFSPLYSMSKWLARKVIDIPSFYVSDPDAYFIDGAHGILTTSEGNWREIERTSALVVPSQNTFNILEIELINQSATTSAIVYPTLIQIQQEDQLLAETRLEVNTPSSVRISSDTILDNSPVILTHTYVGTDSAELANQHVFVTSLSQDGYKLPLKKYAYPYVSKVSSRQYYYWGNANTELWDLWQMRSINYVHTLDLWWLKPFHYWDLPKQLYFFLWMGTVTILVGSGVYLKKTLSSEL